MAADSTAKDEVVKAAKALEEKSNYSWTTTNTSAGTQGRRTGPSEGKTEKGGFTTLTVTFGDNKTEAVLKDGKGAVKTQEGWQSLSELSDSEGAGRFFARVLQNMKTPAVQAADLASKTKGINKAKADDVYAGELTEDGAKDLLSFGRRSNDAGSGARDASGSVKFWVKDGTLVKYEYNVKGKVSFNNNDIDIDRTSTVEIKDVDSTKVIVPEEAKSKASS
jgi:hypothetical protein